MNVRRLIPSTVLAGATALGLVGLTACAADESSGRTKDGKLDVVASFYPVQFLAERIGGEHVEVTALTKPGTEPHDLELKPRQIGRLSEAGLVVYLKGVQPAVDDAIEENGPEHIAELSTFTELEEHGSAVDGHGHEDEEHGADEHAEEGHDHGHDGDADPHVWLDPVKYAEAAEGVGKALQKADPDHAADYRKNTAGLVRELHALDTEFKEGLAGRSSDTFITTHAAFGYLADRYGLRQEAISGVDPESEPSPARIRELHETAEHEKVGTVFFETLASDRTARTLADDLNLKTDVLDPLEGITDRSRGDDYFAVQRANLKALRQALGAR
ncbi:zinc ABC transporter substrate-binding protein [Streptomyces pactum]|uniref:Zinc ABC transporter substrate-binding protein n=1 Tax=Streptomyces pactum TaxID=68249 RepID=A0ABS0NHV3_9ACTN|nr:metal ABC transporter substrate-binding protein [Streptomyces pactum]MBH5334741.1 zinc ABC transporter substrate-binding protein [Streptomyces pactum]